MDQNGQDAPGAVQPESNQLGDDTTEPMLCEELPGSDSRRSASSSAQVEDGHHELRNRGELVDEDIEDVCRTIGKIDMGKLRMALQSAVYISPMLLLSDVKIYRWNWNQIDVLKVRMANRGNFDKC